MGRDRLVRLLLLVSLVGGLVGCAPRDIARLAPEMVVRPATHPPVTTQVQPAATAGNTAQQVQRLVTALKQNDQFLAIPREDGQISFQFVRPGYVGTLAARPLLDQGAITQPGVDLANGLDLALAVQQPSRLLGNVRNDIYPALVNEEQRQALEQAGMEVFTTPLSGSLAIAFAVDRGGVQWLVDKNLGKGWGLRPDELQALAWQNMWSLTAEGPQSAGEGSQRVILYSLRDGYDASRALLTPYIRYLSAELKGRVVIGLPSRDVLMVFGDDDPTFMSDMEKYVANAYRQSDHGLSPALFTLQGDQLVSYPVGPTLAPPPTRQLSLSRVTPESH